MKAKNLRIGNIIYYDPCKKYLNEVDGEDISLMENDDKYLANHEPILITNEWLESLGFEKYHGVYRVRLTQDKYIRGHIANAFSCCIDDCTCEIEGRISINIGEYKYVHELQNLFFGLTGSELKYEKQIGVFDNKHGVSDWLLFSESKPTKMQRILYEGNCGGVEAYYLYDNNDGTGTVNADHGGTDIFERWQVLTKKL